MIFSQERTSVAMGDNFYVYRIIGARLRQLYPNQPKGNFALRLNTLAALMTGR